MQHRKNYRDVDITGNRYGRLVAIEKVPNLRTEWLFQCDCGNKVRLKISRVLYGQLSCGCMRKEICSEWGKSQTTHGMSKTKLYRKYCAILDRCYRKGANGYQRYGGRGITVCEEWKNSFEAFMEWAYRTGYNPELDGRTEQSLDRIDNSGPYSPDNCKWSTPKEQMENRDITKLYPYKDKMYTASSFADKFGIYDKTFVYGRIKRHGMSLEEVLDCWNMIHHTPDGYMRSADYAKLCNVNVTTVNRWIREKKIEAKRVGSINYVVVPKKGVSNNQ